MELIENYYPNKLSLDKLLIIATKAAALLKEYLDDFPNTEVMAD